MKELLSAFQIKIKASRQLIAFGFIALFIGFIDFLFADNGFTVVGTSMGFVAIAAFFYVVISGQAYCYKNLKEKGSGRGLDE
ncbi:hypothetical protein [Microbulbifer guangxiensis]|uniref:hypothetical protein n=1 Tax=Microbulbifer guangxiensis TaxID=2904249 RepID=UPI001F263BED|nr:hypothetical protein [Microbulbifer guangxiensis]